MTGSRTGSRGCRPARRARSSRLSWRGTGRRWKARWDDYSRGGQLTMFSKPKEYDQATQLLRDLHVIARREDDIAAFTARVRELRTGYAKRPSLMERFDKAGLPRLE